MSRKSPIPIFDGHNDTLLHLGPAGRSFLEEADWGHIDLPRAKAGGLTGGFFAIWIPEPGRNPDPRANASNEPNANLAQLAPALDEQYARDYLLNALSNLFRIVRASNGALRVIRSVADVRRNHAEGAFSIEIHLEGADPVDTSLNLLETLYEAGLRSLGIVWSRPNAFGYGVPIRSTGSADNGPGLTKAGKALVRACNELGILVDLSHLNEAGFWDVAKISDRPLVATHSNARALAPSARNLTDRQLDAIRDSDGLVGVNFHCGFLRNDGNSDAGTTSLSLIADQIDYLASRIGEERVALGSDFDGATMPGDLKDAAGLPKLIDELRARGYDDSTLTKIGFENWLRVLALTWKP